MSMLRTIRLAVSRAIAPTTVVTPDHHSDNNAHNQYVQALRTKQYAPESNQQDVLKGHISVSDIHDLNSDYVKSGICSLGSWSALARAYNQFMKNSQTPKKALEPTDSKLDNFLSEFHAWNAVSPAQMDEEAVLTTCARLSQAKPAKSNEETDAILARVKKCSIGELTAEREAKAARETKKREAMLEQFITVVWSHVYSEQDYTMPASKAEAKAISVLEWVANWNSNNPAEQAGELLLIEDDIKQLRAIAKQDNDNNEDFVEGIVTADYVTKRYA